MRSMATPRRNHQTDSLERLNKALGLAKGDAVVGSDGGGQATLEEELLEGGDGHIFAGGIESLAKQ